MARQLNKLSAIRAKTIGAGRHSDGGGLYLEVKASGSRSWIFVSRRGSWREYGLGALKHVSLAEARDLAATYRRDIAAGVDPRRSVVAAETPTFKMCADDLIEAMEPSWRNPKHRAQWRMTLTKYAAPLHDLEVDRVSTGDVLKVLKPLWLEKPETASRLRGRIEAVLNFAKAKGLRTGENPAAWRGHLDHLLPRAGKLTRGHHAALPIDDMPEFMATLRARNELSARVLEFTILTAARTSEALFATWGEIDREVAIWSVPSSRMKMGRPHRVPLSSAASDLLVFAHDLGSEGFVFPGFRHGKPLSTNTMDALLSRLKVPVTVHGFRSTFRDWAAERTDFPSEVVEMALAHTISSRTEAAYRRGDLLEKRRALMQAWSSFLSGDNRG